MADKKQKYKRYYTEWDKMSSDEKYYDKTNNCNKPIYQLDDDNNIINAFQSIALAQRTTKINNISRAIKTGRKAGGFYWKFQ